MSAPVVMTSVKRPRTPPSSTSSPTTHSPGYNHQQPPPHKSTRIAPGSLSPRSSTSSGLTIKDSASSTTTVPAVTRHPLLCTLPPTCHRHPTPIADTNELERHYATYHAHVCGVKGCGCVFPDGRLLELVSAWAGLAFFIIHIPMPDQIQR